MALPVVCVEKHKEWTNAMVQFFQFSEVAIFATGKLSPPCNSSWNGNKGKTSAPLDHLVQKYYLVLYWISLTSSTGTLSSVAMKPSIEKTTTPAKTDVPELITAIATASRWQLLLHLL